MIGKNDKAEAWEWVLKLKRIYGINAKVCLRCKKIFFTMNSREKVCGCREFEKYMNMFLEDK